MTVLTTTGWDEYSLLDSGNGRRLERYGKYVLSRPDPQAIWAQKQPISLWEQADAVFLEGKGGKGAWQKRIAMPDSWEMQYKSLVFRARLSSFKHTGVFPEQHLQWDRMEKIIQNSEFKVQNKDLEKSLSPLTAAVRRGSVRVLNLFGYTGIASLVCASAGAEVTHVDGSKGAISWARENQALSHLEDKPLRWILDDALAFAKREVRRGNMYEGILLDPPVYGHGPTGETWDFMHDFPELLKTCKTLLSPDAIFCIVNAYAITASSMMLSNMLSDVLQKRGGKMESGELAIQEIHTDRLLSTGIFASWNREE